MSRMRDMAWRPAEAMTRRTPQRYEPSRYGRVARTLVGVSIIIMCVAACGGKTTRPSATAVPSAVRAQVNRFGVFRRRQTVADRAGNRYLGSDAARTLTRLVATRPGGKRYFLFVVPALGRYAIRQLTTTAQGAAVSSGPNVTTFPAPCCAQTAAGRTTFTLLVPDGVANVRWTWPATASRPAMSVSMGTPNNFAIATVPSAYSAFPLEAAAYDRGGRLTATHRGG